MMSNMTLTESINEAWNWAIRKTVTQASISQDHFPHVAEQGRYDRSEPQWWTAGFWPGLLWLVYEHGRSAARAAEITATSGADTAMCTLHMNALEQKTDAHERNDLAEHLSLLAQEKNVHKQQHDQTYEQIAEWAQSCERQLEFCLHDTELVDHDLGFIWLLSGVAHYVQTGNADARRRSLLAANLLAARFNVNGNYIRAWNFESAHMDTRGVAIIDSMMNLPLLYWASLETGDPRYRELAIAHADTVAREFVRTDHSICHVVEFDPVSGQKRCEHGGQGYAPGSAWARGTAWALHGFALAYAYTGQASYLELSRQTAQFFLTQLGENIVPYWDFRAPEACRNAYDSSATAIAASGLLELARHVVDNQERHTLQQVATRLLTGLYEHYSTRDSADEGLITHGTVHYPEQRHLNVPIIYGDYFFVEALIKLRGAPGLFTPGL
ncbi:glycoside hydrolase family 88 protein [Paenibacillus campi]|uniref:glycoside hydrolase family 88 protein n=1 Tax=Paenibacillus campi TaxID=3106031 RepID=UPI002AFEF624|nr:glycoside hydrolase family 88 protein [Paenibacillus sp. SGZ-1014]